MEKEYPCTLVSMVESVENFSKLINQDLAIDLFWSNLVDLDIQTFQVKYNEFIKLVNWPIESVKIVDVNSIIGEIIFISFKTELDKIDSKEDIDMYEASVVNELFRAVNVGAKASTRISWTFG